MTLMDMLIIGGAALIGWWVVSWLFDARKRKASPEPTQISAPAQEPARESEPSGLSLMELGLTWWKILGVRPDASTMEIETGYQAALAECDRERLSGSAEAAAAAAARRQKVQAAYEFIRSVRRDNP